MLSEGRHMSTATKVTLGTIIAAGLLTLALIGLLVA
jgi:acyl dehydratase